MSPGDLGTSPVARGWRRLRRRSAADPGVAAVLRDNGVTMASAGFGMYHEIGVTAPPERVWEVLATLTVQDLPMTRWLSAVRYPGRRRRTDTPLLSGGPLPVVHRSPPDLVIAAGISRPWQLRPSRYEPISLRHWAEFDEPGWVKIVLAFAIRDGDGGACRLRSDTLVWPTSPGARARFVPYWTGIEPFATVIRGEILTAVARRAGACSHSDRPPPPEVGLPARSSGCRPGGAAGDELLEPRG